MKSTELWISRNETGRQASNMELVAREVWEWFFAFQISYIFGRKWTKSMEIWMARDETERQAPKIKAVVRKPGMFLRISTLKKLWMEMDEKYGIIIIKG